MRDECSPPAIILRAVGRGSDDLNVLRLDPLLELPDARSYNRLLEECTH
jgi:hypothetical protein